MIALFDALAVEHPLSTGCFSNHVVALFDALAVEHHLSAGCFVRCVSSRTFFLFSEDLAQTKSFFICHGVTLIVEENTL